MGHYKSNLRDLEFNLFEVLGRQDVLGTGPYAEVDAETARSILAEVERLSSKELAESLLDSDRNPPVFDPKTGTAPLPDSFKKSYQAWMDSEWWRLDLPEALGGTVAPASLRWAVLEMVLGANPAVHMYASGQNMAHVIHQMGTPEQQKMAQHMVDRNWGGTMVLTEPDAGSDVGAGRTKAIKQDDGTWHIEGVKRFITSGEQDLTDNIMHLTLARPEGAQEGTKGLSLFLVPKYLFDVETGELGERNGVHATNVEKKMGLKVSNTCEMTYGGETPAVGYLLGEVHDGIRQMFLVIEFARMMVGTKAIATLSTGYLNALEYAKTRVQGPDLTRFTDKSAPRVEIINHPEVRRSLMNQKAYTEGLRALYLYTASIQDDVYAAQLTGRTDEMAERLNDLLLPIVKGYGSEKSYQLLADALQIFGGSGYLQEYPLEQYIRDAKIDTLYEGTTAIQSMDLFFRKIVRDRGQALMKLSAEIAQFAQATDADFDTERKMLNSALEQVGGVVGHMVQTLESSREDVTNLYKVGQNTVRLLMVMGDLICAWLLLRHAAVARDKLAGDVSAKDRDFYTGKIAAARFFARNVLPTIKAQLNIAQRIDNSLMEVPESAF